MINPFLSFWAPQISGIVSSGIRRLRSSPIVIEVRSPDFSRLTPSPSPHPYSSPGAKAPTEVTLITGLGKLFCNNNTHTLIVEDDSGWKISLSQQISRLSCMYKNDYKKLFAWQQHSSQERRVESSLVSLNCSFSDPGLTLMCMIGLMLSQQLRTDTHLQIYLELPDCSLFLGRLSPSALTPPFL